MQNNKYKHCNINLHISRWKGMFFKRNDAFLGVQQVVSFKGTTYWFKRKNDKYIIQLIKYLQIIKTTTQLHSQL